MLRRDSESLCVMQQYAQFLVNSSVYGIITPARKMLAINPMLRPKTEKCRASPPKEPDSKVEKHKSSATPKPPNVEDRESPSRSAIAQQAIDIRYAGALFSHSPPPTELPKPPTRWMKGKAVVVCNGGTPENNARYAGEKIVKCNVRQEKSKCDSKEELKKYNNAQVHISNECDALKESNVCDDQKGGKKCDSQETSLKNESIAEMTDKIKQLLKV